MEEKPPMSEDVGAPIVTAPAYIPRRRGLWLVVVLPILTFALGILLTVWAFPRLQQPWGSGVRQVGVADPYLRGVAPGGPARPLSGSTAQILDTRVAQLEDRLNRITVEAQAASGNATRAEGLMVAFAARRALDSGSPLGYVEGQLRLRFGQAQPRAVATIINAAREPVTLADLRGSLSNIAGDLTVSGPNTSWWEAIEHETRELITIRRASTPSPRPQAAMDRALHYLDAGRVGAALAEVEKMPGRGVAERWMQLARRYLEARRALDLIETAAILEPRELRPVIPGAAEQTTPPIPG
jgi:hypothetical protein